MKQCNTCEVRKRLEEAGIKAQSFIDGCAHDGTARFLWYGPVPKNERDADRLIKAFLKAFGITKTQGRKKTLNLPEIEKAIAELPATATVEQVAGRLKVSKRTLERYLSEDWGEPFHDMQARIHGKPKPSRLKRKLGKRKTRKKMF